MRNLMLALAVAAMGLGTLAVAQDATVPEVQTVTVTGTINAVRDGETLTGITLSCKECECEGECECPCACYQITVDDNATKIITGCDGHTVEVTGTIAERDGQRWLTVTSATCATCAGG